VPLAVSAAFVVVPGGKSLSPCHECSVGEHVNFNIVIGVFVFDLAVGRSEVAAGRYVYGSGGR